MRIAAVLLLAFVTSLAVSSRAASLDEERDLVRDGLKAYVVADVLRTYRHTETETILIDVEVRPDGTVGQAHSAKRGDRGTENLVRNWTFLPFAGTQPHWQTITLILEADTDGERSFESRYESPLTLRVKRHLPLILHVPRVDGAIPGKICSVHHVAMTVELLPILWGLIEPRDDEMVYFDAQEQRFPNARDIIFGGCEEGTESRAEVYICAKCRQARATWLAAHPDVQPAN